MQLVLITDLQTLCGDDIGVTQLINSRTHRRLIHIDIYYSCCNLTPIKVNHTFPFDNKYTTGSIRWHLSFTYFWLFLVTFLIYKPTSLAGSCIYWCWSCSACPGLVEVVPLHRYSVWLENTLLLYIYTVKPFRVTPIYIDLVSQMTYLDYLQNLFLLS